MMGMVAGCGIFAFFSYKQQEDASRQFPEHLLGNSPHGQDRLEQSWSMKMPELTQGLQFMEQRLLYLEVQIQEVGRSHSTSSGLLLRPVARLLGPRKGSAEAALSNYRVSTARFASASSLSEAEPEHPPESAIDQDDTTRMACKGCVWTGDFGKAVILFSISIDWESCDCKDDSATKIEVAVMPGGPWQLYTNAGGFHSFGGHTRRSHVMMAEARYVRISVTETSPSGFYSIWEVAAKVEATGTSEDASGSALAAPLAMGVASPTGEEASPETVEEAAPPPFSEDLKTPEFVPPPTPAPPPVSSASDLKSEKIQLYRADNKCGKRVPLLAGGGPVQCNPFGIFPCCGALGWCGNTMQHCNCPGCVDYRTVVAPNALPAQPASVPRNVLPGTDGGAGGEIVVAVIIPFRDREAHLEKFKPWWAHFAKEGLVPPKVTRWDIYIAEQFDGDSFNRGWNFNVGLALASGQTSACEDITDAMKVPFKCAVIQDIDYLPEKLVDYSECSVPTQLSAEIDRYDWKTPYLQSAGGIVSMNQGHWQQINGFSNDYFGWGGEDDELHHRLRLTGLLFGDCYPFCKPGDPSKGKVGLSIKRPPKGEGRFSGHYMHSMNHTKRITDHKAYQNNVKLLQQIQSGQPRWRSDGLSNLAFRIVSYEQDTSYLKEYGIVYHHVKARRGRDPISVPGIQVAVPTSLCTSAAQVSEARWHLSSLSDPIPWNLKSLRVRVGNILKEHCDPQSTSAEASNFILVDRRYHLAKILSDDNPNMLVAFYRGLHDPMEDGLIIADPRTPEQIREAFDGVKARVFPPTEYTICTSKLSNGELKYSMHQGPACAGGWDKLPSGTFWAFSLKTAEMQAVTFCDNSRYWVQRIVLGETCAKEWGGMKWAHGGTFWASHGNKYCVGTREGEIPYSMALPEPQCTKDPFQHQFGFGTEHYAHRFGSFSLCIGRKDGHSRVSIDGRCESDGFQKLLRFRVRVPRMSGENSQEFCVVSGGASDEIRHECDGSHLKFSVPLESYSTTFTLVCSGPELSDPSRNIVGIGSECEEGPDKTVDVKYSFKTPTPLDVAASTPSGGNAYPFYTLVDEDVPCQGLFCRNVIACAESQSDPGEPCAITAS